MSDLNSGKGRCQGTARLLVKPTRGIIELGALSDTFQAACRLVHHVNRHGSVDDFIAIAFPRMKKGRSLLLSGDELELIGSYRSLENLLNLDGFKSLYRRQMIEETEIGDTFTEPGMIGAAYIRDRRYDRKSEAFGRRNQSRAERRGVKIPSSTPKNGLKPEKTPPHFFMRIGHASLNIREVPGEFSDAPMMVSTYGLSSRSEPAILPVLPESSERIEDAA